MQELFGRSGSFIYFSNKLRDKAKNDVLGNTRAEGFAEGKVEGRSEGIAIGEKRRTIEIAKKMKQRGIDMAVIMEVSVEDREKWNRY